MTSNIPPLQLTNLTKRYGGLRAVDSLSLDVEHGEVFGFLGPNGAGKSTTIRMIMNFQTPTSGTAKVFGLDSVKDSQVIKKRVGYLAGELAVYDDLTGRKFLEYLGSFNESLDWTVVDSLADRFQVDLGRKLKNMSKGNRQKIGLIQAFMHQPDLVILDEPTSGLDPLMQEEFFSLVQEQCSRGVTIFFSSHNISEIQRVADRAAFIRKGELVGVEDVGKLHNLSVHNMDVVFGKVKPKLSDIKKLSSVKKIEFSDATGSFVVQGSLDEFVKFLAGYEVLNIQQQESSLEDVFMKYYEGRES